MRPRPRSSQWLMMWITNLKGSTKIMPYWSRSALAFLCMGRWEIQTGLGSLKKTQNCPDSHFPVLNSHQYHRPLLAVAPAGGLLHRSIWKFHAGRQDSEYDCTVSAWINGPNLLQPFSPPQSPLRNVVWIFYKKLDYSTWKWMCSWGSGLRRVKLWMGKNWNRRWRPSTIGSLLWMDLNPSGWMS